MGLAKGWLLVVLVAGCGCGRPSSELNLCDLLESASQGPLRAPSAELLGDYTNRPFLGLGWASNQGSGPLRALARPQLRFYLERPEAVELEMDPPSALLLNHQPWAHQLGVAGLNLVEPIETHTWKRFGARLALEGRAFDGSTARTRREKNNLLLAFGHTLAYPPLGRTTRLVWDDLKPWVEPGAPNPHDLRLKVHLEGEKSERTWTVQNPGPGSLELEMPGSPTLLKLESVIPAACQPGQLGLTLVGPRLVVQPEPEKSPPVQPAPPSGHRPNVILYLIDTLRSDHLGCYGYPLPTSPRIDRFRQDGVLFQNCQAQSNWTKPSTASILTSMLPDQHQALDFGDRLSSKAVPVAQLLQQAGYTTRAVVTNPIITKTFGFERGFDQLQFIGKNNFREEGQGTCQQVNEAIFPWLRVVAREKPFFLYLHTCEPHLPYSPPGQHEVFNQSNASELIERRWTAASAGISDPRVAAGLARAVRLYDGEIRTNDQAFGELVDLLKAQKLYDNTLIVLISDHGDELLDHGSMGHMNSLYQELLSVPLLIKFPGSVAAGTRIEGCWRQIDVVPTILGCLGLPPAPTMVGRAFLPANPKVEDRPAFSVVRTGGDRKGQVPPDFPPWLLDMQGVRFKSWVYNRTRACLGYDRLEPEQLYNLASDPKETHNLVEERPVMAAWLNALLQANLGQGQASAQADPLEAAKILRSLQYLQ